MKKLSSITALILILFLTLTCQAQPRKTVHGNNKVVTKDREAGSFSGIRASTGIDVYLKRCPLLR